MENCYGNQSTPQRGECITPPPQEFPLLGESQRASPKSCVWSYICQTISQHDETLQYPQKGVVAGLANPPSGRGGGAASLPYGEGERTPPVERSAGFFVSTSTKI